MALRITDDGATVELDLHGVGVDDALDLVEDVVAAAVSRGRSTVKVIHGSSTSDRRSRNRTIKHVLEDELASGGIFHVTGHVTFEAYTLLSLPVSSVRDPRPLLTGDFR